MGMQHENGNQGLRKIPKWAGRYSRNRTLSVVASLTVFILGAVLFGGLSYLTGLAYVHGYRTLAACGVLMLSAWSAFWIWFSFVGARRLLPEITAWLYRGEGQVSPDQTSFVTHGPKPTWVAPVFALCVATSVGLGMLGIVPMRLMQPVSAIYVVPFLLYLGWALRDLGSPFMFMWPLLYGAHAILLLFSVMPSLGPMLDMFVPTIGYGLVAAIAGHIYSRLALRRLRSLASESHGPEA